MGANSSGGQRAHRREHRAVGPLLAAASAGLLCFAEPGFAADLQSAVYAPAAPARTSTAWELSIAPYVWFAGLKGDLGGPGGAPDVRVDTSFSDIFHALKFGAMAMGTARYGRWVGAGDLIYVDLANSRNLSVRDPGLVTGALKVKQFMSTLAGGYRAVDRAPFSVDLLAGLRIVAIDQDTRLSGPTRSFSGRASTTLVDPIIGTRMSGPLSGNWGYDLYGDVGGFGASSKLTWQLMGVVKYHITDSWSAAGGWRHIAIDTSTNGFRFDAAMDGPILGASYRF